MPPETTLNEPTLREPKRSPFVHRKTLIGVLLGLGGVFYLTAGAQPPEIEEPRPTTAKRVRVAAVEAVRESREMRFSGTTRATKRARVALTVGGRLVERPVEIGDRVAAGAVLARLDDRELENAVATAAGALAELEARRAQAERDAGRARKLRAAKAATQEEVEQSEATVDALDAALGSSRARLAEAKRRLGEAILEAPFDSRVNEVLVEPGENVVPGQAVVVLAGDGGVEVELEVPESVLRRLEPGTAVRVRLPFADGAELAGRIASLARTAGGPGSLFPVVVALAEHPDLLPGVTAEILFTVESADGLALPVEAVVNPGGQRPTVYRVVAGGDDGGDDGGGGTHVEKLPIEVGSLLGERLVVRGDLRDGDLVVVGGQLGLVDGDVVEVVP